LEDLLANCCRAPHCRAVHRHRGSTSLMPALQPRVCSSAHRFGQLDGTVCGWPCR